MSAKQDDEHAMKISLINPPQLFTKSQVTTCVTPPIGLAYIAAILANNNLTVNILDALGEGFDRFHPFNNTVWARGLTIDEIVARIKRDDPDLVGISNHYTFAFPLVRQLAGAIKQAMPVPVVVGGAHASAEPRSVLMSSPIDYVVIGEGEQTTLDLVEHLRNGLSLDQIDGIAYKSHDRIVVNPKTRFIANLDGLPFPRRDMLPMDNYFRAREAHGGLKETRWTSVITSRGCPFSCSFCSTPGIWHRLWRARSPENVVDEIEECVDKWKVREIHFEDDNMAVDIRRFREICNAVIERKLDLVWQTPNGLRVENLDRKTLSLMKRSGCYHITVAPDSASRHVQDLMNKKVDLANIRNVVTWCRDLGIRTGAFFILGFPGETREDLSLTLKYSRLLAREGLDDVVYSLFTPFPGSEIGHKFGHFDEYDYLACGDLDRVPPWYGENGPYLNRMRLWAYVSFHLTRFIARPTSFLGFLDNLIHSRQETKTERTVLGFMKHLRTEPNE
jgi:anaerobic magnesium-protoporphyrin IX monomethyl ester cyclase